MPTYEYLCENCGYRFEKFQKITDEPIKKCPRCGGKVKRLISGGAGLIFKGSGFYETDYKRKEEKKKEGTSSSLPNKKEKVKEKKEGKKNG